MLMFSAPALAWGPLGHQVAAALAQRQLTPSARAEVERLLAPEHDHTLVDIANWADNLRDDASRQTLWQQTRKLHYINFRGHSCRYERRRDCRNGQCVVAAIDKYQSILGDRHASDAARRQALKFVVHFVADVHQPLHAGNRPDKGGNEVQVRYQGKGWNLHSIWDSALLNSRHLRWKAYAEHLAGEAPLSLPPASAHPAAAWAEESCRIVRDDGVYPVSRYIGHGYIERERPIAEHRLREAGARLARLLNRLLSN